MLQPTLSSEKSITSREQDKYKRNSRLEEALDINLDAILIDEQEESKSQVTPARRKKKKVRSSIGSNEQGSREYATSDKAPLTSPLFSSKKDEKKRL